MAIFTVTTEVSRWFDRWTNGSINPTHQPNWTPVCSSKYKQMLHNCLVDVLTSKSASVAGVMLGLVFLVLTSAANATPFLEDFEGDGDISQTPVSSLRNWNIINSVDLQTESYPLLLCHLSGACIDLVGTTGVRTGGIISKRTYPSGTYEIGFFLYGSGRDGSGNAVGSGGTVSRIQVSLGSKSIYANNNMRSNFDKFVVVRVRGSGKLKFIGTGEVSNIGPILDNVVIIPLSVSGAR